MKNSYLLGMGVIFSSYCIGICSYHVDIIP